MAGLVFWVSGLIFGMSVLVFWMSGLGFGMLGLAQEEPTESVRLTQRLALTLISLQA